MGGGRDRDQIAAHVAEAERSYARKLGVRFTPTQSAAPGGQQAMRDAVVEQLRTPSDGSPLVDKGWPARCSGCVRCGRRCATVRRRARPLRR